MNLKTTTHKNHKIMKTITTIPLLVISLLACNGQVADTLIYYTESDLIELKAEYDLKLDSCSEIIER